MKIESVIKLHTGGFKVNNQFFIPEDIDDKVYQEILLWKDKGNIIEDEFSSADLLKKAKKLKKAEINAQRDANVLKPILFKKDGKDYYLSRTVQNELSWLQNANRNTSTEWVADNNKIISISQSDFKNISAHLGVRDSQEYTLARKRKDAVELLTSIEEVEAYDITTTDLE